MFLEWSHLVLQIGRDGLRLGIFKPNCSNSLCITNYKPESDDGICRSYKDIVIVAQEAWFDFLFPVSRWL